MVVHEKFGSTAFRHIPVIPIGNGLFTNDERVGLRTLAKLGIITQNNKRWVVTDEVGLPYLSRYDATDVRASPGSRRSFRDVFASESESVGEFFGNAPAHPRMWSCDSSVMKLQAKIIISYRADSLGDAGDVLDDVLQRARERDDIDIESIQIATPESAGPVSLPYVETPPAPPQRVPHPMPDG